MSTIAARILIEDAAVEPLGVKEAITMALEPLGGVQALEIEIQEPEQMSLDGAGPRRSTVPPRRSEGAKRSGQAPARRPVPYVPKEMAACLYCAYYRSDPGRDEAGNPFYGKCVNTGAPVYKLADRCRSYRRGQHDR